MSVPTAMQELYSRPYPRLHCNQWGTTSEGTFSSGNHNRKLDFVARHADIVVMNRAGGDLNDLFLDFYESTHDPNKGLLKLNNDMKTAALEFGRIPYVLPYLNMTDVWYYESILHYPDQNYWHKPNGNNIGSWDYCNDGSASGNGLGKQLWLKNGEEILHYYGGTDERRPIFDMRDADMQEYYAQHAYGITLQGFDGIFSDNWLRTKYTGDLSQLLDGDFADLQDGWNTAGARLKELMGDKILMGNSPGHSAFTSRDCGMLEDRIDNDLEGDKSIQSYFTYTDWFFNTANQAVTDTYWNEASGGWENFRVPMCLLTDCLLGITAGTNTGALVETYAMEYLEALGKIGFPLQARYHEGGVAKRYFDGGLVIVNDSWTPKTVNLPEGEFKTVWGRAVKSITLPSCEGIVLKRVSYTTMVGAYAPAIPTNLKVVSFYKDNTSGEYFVVLSWKDNSTNEIAWKIFASVNSNTAYTPIKYRLVNRNMAVINLGDFPREGTYAFKIAAVNRYGSTMSNKVEYDITL